MPKKALETIVGFIVEHDDWWADQIKTVVDKNGEEILTAWLNFARTAAPTDMIMTMYALERFVVLVDEGSLDWLNGDLEAVLLAAARRHANGVVDLQEIGMVCVE